MLKQIFIAVTFLMPTVDLDYDSRVIDVLTCGLWPWSRALHTSAELRGGQCCYCNLQVVQQIQRAQEVQSHPCHPERGKTTTETQRFVQAAVLTENSKKWVIS